MPTLSLNLTEHQKSFLESLYEESLKKTDSKGDPKTIHRFVRTLGTRYYGYEKLQSKIQKLMKKKTSGGSTNAKNLLKALSSRKTKATKVAAK